MENFITVAKILKPQGVKGEIKVTTFTDTPDDLKAFARVYIGGNAYKILKVRPQNGDCAFLSLAGVADRNAAETLRGLDISAERGDLPSPADGSFYIADVIGCDVVSESGEKIGTVTDITPARTDIYEYEKTGGGKMLFAAAEGVVLSVDTQNKTMTVNVARLGEVETEE